MQTRLKNTRRKPDWLKIQLPSHANYKEVLKTIEKYKLNTICTSGKCPNLGECWDRGTATIMILGDICTRSCKFCAVKTGRPENPDMQEPLNVAKSVKILKLKHCVLTSVDRDDLPDGGSEIWNKTIQEIKKLNPDTTIEALIPDFNGESKLLQNVINAKPEVISHNLETVERLTPLIRSKAKYKRSLNVLEYIAKSGINTKSGIMVGIGAKWKKIGLEKGFKFVESSPLVRSSYKAEKHV